VDALGRLDEQMALLAEGDRSAIEPLFRALWPLVHECCERALGKGPDADDAAQQATEKMFVEAVRYDRTLPVVPWALAIAAWECRTVQRRRQRARTVPLEMAGDVRALDASPEEAAIEREQSGHRMEGGVVRTRGGAVEAPIRKKKFSVAECVDRPVPFGSRIIGLHPRIPSDFAFR